MTDAPLLAAIRAAPDDDAPRLVYADWLDEHGLPERAEFIRVQVELARRDSPDLRRREAELLAAHHDALAGPLAAAHLQFRFRRGFPVGFGHTGVFGARNKSGANPMLRFFPNGHFERASMTQHPVRISTYFESGNPYLSRGMYVLTPFDNPVGIRLKFGEFTPWAFRGVLEGNSLTIAFGKPDKVPYSRETYSHIHIPDFNSFPET